MTGVSIRPFCGVLAAALAVATAFPGGPEAFTLNGPRWAQARTLYYVNPDNLDLGASAAEAAVRAGADTWLQQAAGFLFAYGGSSSQSTLTNDAINLVLFRNASSGSAIATTYWWSSSSRIIDADIVFWDGAVRFFAGSSGCGSGFYVEDIAAHEFGHALGLGHSTLASATMYPSASACDTRLRSLDADDISGVQALYPAPPPPTGVRIVR
jgi:hypothetical protein